MLVDKALRGTIEDVGHVVAIGGAKAKFPLVESALQSDGFRRDLRTLGRWTGRLRFRFGLRTGLSGQQVDVAERSVSLPAFFNAYPTGSSLRFLGALSGREPTENLATRLAGFITDDDPFRFLILRGNWLLCPHAFNRLVDDHRARRCARCTRYPGVHERSVRVLFADTVKGIQPFPELDGFGLLTEERMFGHDRHQPTTRLEKIVRLADVLDVLIPGERRVHHDAIDLRTLVGHEVHADHGEALGFQNLS